MGDNEVVRGVKLGVARLDVMNVVLVRLGRPEAETAEAAIGSLADWVASTGGEILECTECAGLSPTTLDWCPFCGEGAPEGAIPARRVVDPLSGDRSPETDPPLSSAAPNGDAEALAGKVGPGPEKIETVEDLAAAVGAEEDAKAAKKAARKKPRADMVLNVKLPPLPADMVVRQEPAPAVPVTVEQVASASLVVAESDVAVLAPPSELDRVVSDIRDLKSLGAHTAWMLGKKLVAANSPSSDGSVDALWKLRVGEDGKPAHRNFEQFVDHECGLTPSNAWNLIDLAKEWEEEQVRTLGPTKLTFVMKVAERYRSALVEKIEAGATLREVADEVRGIVGSGGGSEKERRGKGGSEAHAAAARENAKKATAAAAAARDQVTAVVALKKHVVKLFQKGSEEKRAKKVGDRPTGYLELTNRVRARIVVRANAKGELEAEVSFERTE